jgi:nucleoid DNA-binding protein
MSRQSQIKSTGSPSHETGVKIWTPFIELNIIRNQRGSKGFRFKEISKSAVKCVGFAITSASKKREKVILVGFGTFSAAKRAARKAENPRTDEGIKIKAKNCS